MIIMNTVILTTTLFLGYLTVQKKISIITVRFIIHEQYFKILLRFSLFMCSEMFNVSQVYKSDETGTLRKLKHF